MAESHTEAVLSAELVTTFVPSRLNKANVTRFECSNGGQASRAALARALLRARPVLLLDEPFAALGPAMRAEMLALVREVATETGALVLMVTHDPEDARALGGDTSFVADGVAHPPLETAALLANPPPALQDYLGRK